MTAEVLLAPHAMVAGGAALARDDEGRVVFVDGALPGERVRARMTEERRDFARATAVEVVEASPDRVAPPCPTLTAGCGGCTWQHVAPGAQHRLKAAIVLDALRRITRLDDPPEPVQVTPHGPALRTTTRLAVSASGRAGHRARSRPGRPGPTDPVVTDTCLVAHPLLEELVVDGRYPGSGEVLLRVGVASGERLVRTDAHGARVEVPTDVVVVRKGERAFVHEEVAGRRFRVSADSFFQPGPVAAEALVAAVSAAVGDALGPGGHLLDAYAGVGLFASTLGSASGDVRVTAIEQHPAAVADARTNLADLDARVARSEVGRWRPRQGERGADVVVADPSRPGLGRPGVAALAGAGATRLVLVSCDPASLARDARLLAGEGYALSTLALVDAFPHTFHVEAVARFDR